MKLLSIAFIATTLLSNVASADQQQCPRLATTTSMKSSGLLTVLKKIYETENDCTLEVHSLGTGAALRLGRTGAVDVLLVHAPAAEEKFIVSGYGIKRIPVMSNDFLIAGPPHDPANIKSAKSIAQALLQILETKSLFLSRGDDSGTHKKEKQLWKAANLEPYGSWYYEAGIGMGGLLTLSEEKQGYLMIDRATWLWNKNKVTLVPLFEGGETLVNYYSVIAISPRPDNSINITGADIFIRWITSDKIQKVIAKYKIKGQQLFHPASLP